MPEIRVEVAKLLHVLKVIDLVPNIAGFPSSTFVRLQFSGNKGLTLSLAAELCGTVSVEAEGDLSLKGSIFCDRNLLFPFLSVAQHIKSKKPFVFTYSEGRLHVTHGKRKGKFDCADKGMGYREANFDGRYSELKVSEAMLRGLQLAASCATEDTTVPELNCVYMHQNDSGTDFYGSNQLLAVKTTEKLKASLPEFLAMPLLVLPHLSVEGLKHILLYKNEVVLCFDCGTLWQSLSIKAQKGFPYETIDKLIAGGKKLPEKFRLQTKRLGIVTSRFSQYLASAGKQDWLMRLRAPEGAEQLLLEVKIPQGVFREYVTLDAPVKEEIKADWSFDILLPVLEHFYKLKDAVLHVRFAEDTPYFLTAESSTVVLTGKKEA